MKETFRRILASPLLMLSVLGFGGFALVWFLAYSGDRSLFPDGPEGSAHWELAVWRHVEQSARRERLDPDFVFAIVWAESSLNPRARTDVARGMMQLTEGAWKTVSNTSWDEAWNWRKNIDAGVLYLADNRRFLENNDAFSYPMLAASYRFGRNAMKRNGFSVEAIPATRNRIYQKLFAGELQAVNRPVRPLRLS